MASIDYNFTFLLFFLFFNARGQSLSGPSLRYLSNSTATTLAYSSGLPGSITSAPLSSGTAKKCPLCQVNWLDGGGVPVRFYWYTSILGLTLDTVSIIVTQYNNTAITTTTTIHGDVNSLNISAITTAIEIASAFAGINQEYPGPFIVLANGTDGNLSDGQYIPYPTAYVKFNDFGYTTVTRQLPNCPAGQQEISGRCECALTSWYPPGQLPRYMGTSVVSLPNAYYTVVDAGKGSMNGNFFEFNNVSLSEWFVSDTALMNAVPQLSTCFYIGAGHGPPVVKIPVSALTATSTTTVKGSGHHSSYTAQPANSVTDSVPAPTSKVPAGSKTWSAPSSSPAVATEKTPQPSLNTLPGTISSTPLINLETTSTMNAAVPSDKISPSPALVLPDPPNSSRPSAGSPSPASQSDDPETPKSPKSSISDPEPKQQNFPGFAKQMSHIPIIIFGGSTINADSSSYYALPSIGILKPGVSDITTNSVVYSLAPSTAAIISNGDLISLDHVGQPTYAKPEPTPILSLGTALYTAHSSSQFIISGQTVKPGGPAITVAGTPISLDAAGSVALIGTSTQPMITPAPVQKAAALIFAGSTFTANSASEFVVAGQTLMQESQITVSGVPISLNSGGTVAIIGTSTQHLIHDHGSEITQGPAPSPIQETPILTFAGSTFTANSASQFVVAGQTLTQGSQITVSGVPISLNSGGTIAIIGTSTQNLIHGYGPELARSSAPSVQETPVLTFGKSIFTADAASHFFIAGQALTQGGQITVSGTPISLAQNGRTALIGTSTQTLIHDYTPTLTRAPVFNLGATTYTADVSSHFIIEGQTLLPGGVLTIAGTRVSYPPTGSDIIIGTSTEAIHLGNLIMQGLGGATDAASTAPSTLGLDRPGNGSTTRVQGATGGAEGFTGGAQRALKPRFWRSCGIVVGLMVGLCVL